MSIEYTSIIFSIVATTLATLSFFNSAWRIWRDRPRLIFYVHKVIIHNRPDNKKFNMLQIKACNIGFRQIILTKCVFVGKKSSFYLGTNDEPAATYGVENQIFPSILDPGKTLTFHPITIEALERNYTDPKNPRAFYDPYKYIILFDSYNKLHYIDVMDVRWQLHMDSLRNRNNIIQKIKKYFDRKILFYKFKKKNLLDF